MSYKQLKDNKWSYKLLKVPYLEGFHPPPEEEVRKPDLYIQQQSDDTVIPQPQLHQHQQQQQPLQQQYAESKPEVSSDVITTTESNAAGTTKPAGTDSSSPAKETSGGGAKEDDVSRSYRLLPEVLMPPPPAPRNFHESWNRPRMVIKQQQHRQPKHQHQQHPGQQQQQHPGQEQLNEAQDVPKHLIPKQDYRSMQQHFAHKQHQNQQFVIKQEQQQQQQQFVLKQEQQQSAHEQKPFASTSQQQGYGYGGGPNLGVGGPQDPRYSVGIQAPREVKMDGLGSMMMQEANSSMKVSSTTGPESIEFDGNDCVLCRVCGDKASGFHYGVHSCEGCKGFFRRSIQQKIQYRPCSKNQQCSILRINRNRCQYCRLKKCIAAGMSRDAVRFGRVPKREKAKILAAMQSSKAKTIESKVVAEMSDERRLIDTVVRAHYDTCDYTADKIGPFIQAARNKQKLTQCTGQTCPMKGGPQQSFLDEFSDQLMDHVRQVCTFAKFIPGFKCLGKDDQVTLLKSCVFEVLTVRLSGLFDNQSLVCLNGDVIRRETISAMPAGNAKFLMDSVFELAQRINRFRLSDAEIGLFCSVVIISADRPGLMSPGLVSKMQDKLKTVLENILASRHPSPIFKDLTAILADLRVLNTLHTEKFLQQAKVTREEVQAAAASPHSVLGGSGYSGATSDTWEELNIADGDSTGSRSPKSSGSPATSHSFSLEDLQRSPMGGGGGSVSSSESLGGNSETFSKLSVNDLKIHGSVLLNALTSPALSAAAAHHRKRDISRLMGSGAGGGGEPVTNTPRSQEEGPAGGAGESKCPFKARKLDSPSDSGIDSPKAQGSQSTNTSVCSSPRSSMEEGAGGGEDGPDSMEDQHPLLKRALQQPPQPFNMGGGGVTMFQDEVYKPHKKFRHNGRRDGDEPTSTQDGSCSPGPATSILATQLAAPPTYRRASPPPPTAGPPHQSLLATTLSRPVSVARAKRDEERSELLANLILDSGRWRPGHVSQSSSLLMCAPLPAHSPLPSAASPGGAASLRGAGHLPVPVAPTQPTSTLVSPRSSVSATTPHKSTSQLRTALMDASTGGAAQPLNLSVRTPPPADLTQPPEALKA